MVKGIGKNVICLNPTCKSTEEIINMINSARYYPSLMASISYGGLKYLSEYKLIKNSMSLIGDIKVCNVIINCQNIALSRRGHIPSNCSSSIIDTIATIASSTTSPASLNWLVDRDLGAGVLNRYLF